MRICVIGDLHGYLPTIEPCEILLICGDISPLRMQKNLPQCEKWLKTTFAEWIKELPCEQVFLVAGNHDHTFENRGYMWLTPVLTEPTDGKVVYLESNHVDYLSDDGKVYRIWGTPYCHIFGNWAFMYPDDKLKELYSSMPYDCDIVISHDAFSVNDYGTVPPNMWHNEPINAGNEVLTKIILERKPTYAFCGHIHEGNHNLEEIDNVKMANVSLLDDKYDVSYEPLYLDI